LESKVSSRDEEVSFPHREGGVVSSDAEVQNLMIELKAYGISPNQAKLYLYLLGRGSAPVREISKALSLHRVDVYRKLRELESLGMVEVHFDVPKRFVAVNPRVAIGTLVTKLTSDIDGLRKSSIGLENRLASFRVRRKAQNPLSVLVSYSDTSYRYGLGRKNYLREVKQLTRSAKEEVLRVAPPNGLKRVYISGSFREIKSAVERGVTIRLITEINRSNLKFARMLSKIIRVRHLNGVNFRLIVGDRSRVILSTRFDEELLSADTDVDGYFVFEDPGVAGVGRFLFEHLWSAAVEVEKAAGDFRPRSSKGSRTLGRG
jgi:sugar-specific transcriptional regulator TrmB